MKIIIKENEVGFVFKDGKFKKMINAGKYHYSKAFGYKVHIEEMTGEVNMLEVPYEILVKDKNFEKSTVHYQIEDGEIGLIYVNGSIRTFATRSEYTFWNVFDKYEIRKVSMKEARIGEAVTKNMLAYIPTKYYTRVCVGDGEVGLLYFDNVLTETLKPGVYYYWNYQTDISSKIVDLKLNEIDVIGQEILTKDKVGIRMNVACSYKVKDAEKMVTNIKDLSKQLYSYIQLTIRELVGDYKLDEILEQKCTISEEIYAKLKENEDKFYVEFGSAGIKDIILPGEIRDIMNTVLVAEKTAQANVITRREEVASTRSLLNTAKLMDENKTLYKLKELEYLERICGCVGEISVSGNSAIVKQLGELVGVN